MKQVKKIGLFLGCILLIVNTFGCSEEKSNPTVVVTLSTNKTSIKANNEDKAVFSATVDGKDITSSVAIIQKNQNKSVDGMSFSTDSVATYTFFAIYDNIRSNEISIDVIDIEMTITADKQTIKANSKDVVTFSVVTDGQDVTSLATIIQADSPETTKTGFSTNIPGTYTFYATYKGKKSNEIRIEASPITLSLSVDKASIKANNRDKSTFTVNADDENVTSSAVIMQRIVKQNYLPLENNEFYTDEVDYYAFYAEYEGEKSNEVVVEATYVELSFQICYSIVQITSTACPLCVQMTEELEKLKRNYLPNQIQVIAFHPFGKICNSDLAGALSQTAINFVEKVNRSSLPLAIVDLYKPVGLQMRDTQAPLNDALARTKRERDKVSLTGMAVQSTMNGNSIDFAVRFKTLKTDTYRFFAFIVEDSVVGRQAIGDNTRDDNYINNNVATYQLAEGDPYYGVNLGTITEGRELLQAFSINTDQFKTGRNVNFDNCRIVCYTLRSNDGQNYFVDNVTSCPVNGSVRYLYE